MPQETTVHARTTGGANGSVMTDQPDFLGAGWAVDDYKDLEAASQLRVASPITDADNVIGGKTVAVDDPTGGSIYLHWGHNELRQWYLDTFTLAATDYITDPQTQKDIMTFIHLNKGEKYVDHHMSFRSALVMGNLQRTVSRCEMLTANNVTHGMRACPPPSSSRSIRH
ncbi:trihydroxytoluene oxygenase [Ilyonectria robusta]